MTRSVRTMPLFFGGCAGLFIYGIVLALPGTVFGLAGMSDRLHLEFSEQGHVFLLLYLGVFLSTLIVGPLIDSTGHKWVLLTSGLMVAVALAAFSRADSFSSTVLPALLLGFGGGGLCAACNVLVSDLFTEQRGAMLNLLGVSFSVGALFVPLLATGLAGRSSAWHLWWLGAALALACGWLYAVLVFPPARAEENVSLLQTLRVARYPGLLWLGLLLFFESGNEAAIGGWTSIYARSTGLPAREATMVLACYWAGMIGGRLLAPQLLRRLGKPHTILTSSVIAMLGCILLVAAGSVGMLACGAAVVGLSFGPIFQTALGIAGDRYPHCSGSVFGLLFAFALVGAMAAPWAIGQISQHDAVRHGMLLPLFGAGCISLIAGIMVRRDLAKQRALSPAD